MSKSDGTTRDPEGFALLGLLVVMIALAILTAIVLLAVGPTTKHPQVVGTTKAASVAACEATVRSVQAALDAYRAETPTGGYPKTLTALTVETTATPANPKGPWLKQVPDAQLGKNGYQISYTGTATGRLTVRTRTTTLTSLTAAACKAA